MDEFHGGRRCFFPSNPCGVHQVVPWKPVIWKPAKGVGSIALWPGTVRVQWRFEGKDGGGAGGVAFSTLQYDVMLSYIILMIIMSLDYII